MGAQVPRGSIDLPALRRTLLAWYRRHRRAMPWRETRDPYRIWLSEVMLQQTQVATATPYYERFVERFPTATALAEADLDQVLAAWAGLGYYRRARLLHAAAGIVAREHAGRVPRDAAGFAALPGVGRYTLGAVLSIAHGEPLPVLDGNVARVLARVLARPLSIKRPADAKVLWAVAASWMPERSRGRANAPGDWNQALMELGATICTPRAPRCPTCPLRLHCRARALGRATDFPPAGRNAPVRRVRRAVAWIERAGRVLMMRREGPALAGFWEPPGAELPAGADARAALRRCLSAVGVRATLSDSGRRVKHAITTRSITVEVWRGTARGPRPPGMRWLDPRSAAAAIPAMVRKVARALD